WMATSSGIVKYQAGQFQVYSNVIGALDRQTLKRIRIVFEHSSGEVYFTRDFDGLFTFTDGEFQKAGCVDLSNVGRMGLSGFAEDSSAGLWATTERGLVNMTGGNCRLYTQSDGLKSERVFGVIPAADGSVWVGSRDA